MRFIPVLRPFFPLAGILVLHSVIVFALSKDAKRCSKAYITGLCIMELTLISMTLATVAPKSMTVFWDMMVLICRCALCPCWLWMALDMNGMKPARIEPVKAFALAMIPVAVAALVLFTNPLHAWYWSATRFEGRILVVERGVASLLTTAYCQVLLLVASAIYFVGILRHHGNERLRLLLLGFAYGVFFVGDLLWLLGRRIHDLPGVNPLSFLMTICSFIVGASVPLYGYPRIRKPITEEDLRAMAPVGPPRRMVMPATGDETESHNAAGTSVSPAMPAQPALPSAEELSERQVDILRMVMDGRPYKAIAAGLGITERTVKYHMGQILDKCGLETREQLIAWAALHGLGTREEGGKAW